MCAMPFIGGVWLGADAAAGAGAAGRRLGHGAGCESRGKGEKRDALQRAVGKSKLRLGHLRFLSLRLWRIFSGSLILYASSQIAKSADALASQMPTYRYKWVL